VKIRSRQLGKKLSAEDSPHPRPVVAEYKRTSSAYYSTSELWDDGILDPVDTRNALVSAVGSAEHADRRPALRIFRM